MHIAVAVAAASIALSGAALARASGSASQSGLARHLDALSRIDVRGADGCYVVADDDAARIAQEIEQAIHVPHGWHVVLRHDEPRYEGLNLLFTHFIEPSGVLYTTLSDQRDRVLRLALMLDAQWVTLGGAAFIGPYGATEFTSRQFLDREDFLPLSAVPIVLYRLERELNALPLENLNVRDLSLRSPQPRGASPHLRCVLGLDDESPGRLTSIELNGVIVLPATVAHEKGFELAGSRAGGSVSGPVTSTRPLGQCFHEARAMSDLIHSGGEWFAHVFHDNGSDSFPTEVVDARKRPLERYRADLRIDSTGFVGATKEISASIAGVPLTPDGVRQFLKSLAGAYDTTRQYVFLVMGCAERHEITVLFTSAGGRWPTASDLTTMRFVFDVAGSKLQRIEPIPMREIRHATEGRHTRWTCRFQDERVADVWVHRRGGCTTGEDLTSRARIGETDFRVAGGLVETAFRRE